MASSLLDFTAPAPATADAWTPPAVPARDGPTEQWAIGQHISPQEIEDGRKASVEEERLVKSAYPTPSKEVLDWVLERYVKPHQDSARAEAAVYHGDVGGLGSGVVPATFSGQSPVSSVFSNHNRLAVRPQTAPPLDIRPAFADDDEFTNALAVVGRHTQDLSLGADRPRPPSLPGLERTGRVGKGERERMASVRQYDSIIEDAARAAHIDPDYLRAMIRAESSGDVNAMSGAGALGVMQFIPSTARDYGLRVDGEVDERTDPERAIPAGARYFADLLKVYKDYDLAVAAYNAGPGAVDKYHGVPPFRETQNHVRVVREYYDNFRHGRDK